MTPTIASDITKVFGVIYKCRACKRVKRADYNVRCWSVSNNHPDWYLRHTARYRRILPDGPTKEAKYFHFPPITCECGQEVYGKPIEGRLNEKCPCDRRCTGATGHNCECSCGGANHGADHR